MKKSLIAQLVIWLVVIILLGAILAAGIALHSTEGGFFPFSWLVRHSDETVLTPDSEDASAYTMPIRHSEETMLTPDSEDASTYTIDPAGLHGLEISWATGSVELRLSEGAEIKVSEPAGLEEKKRLRCYVENGTLKIDFSQPQWGWGNVQWSWGNVRGKSLLVELPEDFVQNLQEISVDMASADLQAQGLQARKLDVDSASGAIRLENCRLEELSADTASGDLTYTGQITGTFEFDSASGDADLTLESTPRSIDTDTASGNVIVRLPADSSFSGTFDTISGKLNCGFAMIGSQDSFQCGQGASRFQFDSASGDVDILPTT